MAQYVALEKIKDIREGEKQVAQKAYRQSMDSFETIATKLYYVLKKKEEAEASYEEKLYEAIAIDRIKEQAMYIERLNEQIVFLQQQVQHARAEMENKQDQLTEAHVEVKKYEKLIESKKQKELDERKRVEENFMNELSMQQYLSHKNR